MAWACGLYINGDYLETWALEFNYLETWALEFIGKLVLLRHGQSDWNAKNLFAGWVNASLTAVGEQEASQAGPLLAAHGLVTDVVYTSVQQRSIRTAELAVAAYDRDWVPVGPAVSDVWP